MSGENEGLITKVKDFVRKVPVIGPIIKTGILKWRTLSFPGSAVYWENRYRKGGELRRWVLRPTRTV